jgi:hypothetical protein
MDIQKELVFNPALQHIEWRLYAIQVHASSPYSASYKHYGIGLKTYHRGIQISVEFLDSLGKYDLSINRDTIAVLPKVDAILTIEQIIQRIDSANFFELRLGRLIGYPTILDYGNLLDGTRGDRRQAAQAQSECQHEQSGSS